MRTLVFAPSHIQRRTVVNALLALGHLDLIEAHEEASARVYIEAPPEDPSRVDLAIVSWETTDLGSLPLIPWIRRLSTRPSLPTIVVSDRAAHEDVILALRWGADSYIVRPFDADLLARKIESVLKAHSAESGLPAGAGAVLAGAHTPNGADQKPRVLVVDDHQPALTLIALCLQQNYEVVPVSSLNAGITEVASGHFDAAIIDINLDGASGTDLLDVMRTLPQYRNVPKIACTAFAQRGDRERLLALGFDGYVSKPFRKAQLIETLQTIRAQMAHAA